MVGRVCVYIMSTRACQSGVGIPVHKYLVMSIVYISSVCDIGIVCVYRYICVCMYMCEYVRPRMHL